MDDELARVVSEARAAWPSLAVPDDAFRARLAACAGETPAAELCGADLYLATACTRGDRAAIAALERDVLRDVPRFVARFGGGADFADEVTQRLRERLLTGAPSDETPRPRIGDYEGRGPLRAWVRVAANRLAIDLVRERGDGRAAELGDRDAVDPAAPPDLALIRGQHKTALTAAMSAAIGALTRTQRNLLRMHYVDGFTLDRLATAYKVHRATIARRLADAKEEILTRAYDHLVEHAPMSPSEFDSLVAVARSQIDLSITRLFG